MPVDVAALLAGAEQFVWAAVLFEVLGLDGEAAGDAAACLAADGPVDKPGDFAVRSLVGTVTVGEGRGADVGHPFDDEPPADAPLGARTIRLIGTLDEFGVDDRVGHKVWAKGLLNPANAGDADLLNLTSITTLSDRCES